MAQLPDDRPGGAPVYAIGEGDEPDVFMGRVRDGVLVTGRDAPPPGVRCHQRADRPPQVRDDGGPDRLFIVIVDATAGVPPSLLDTLKLISRERDQYGREPWMALAGPPGVLDALPGHPAADPGEQTPPYGYVRTLDVPGAYARRIVTRVTVEGLSVNERGETALDGPVEAVSVPCAAVSVHVGDGAMTAALYVASPEWTKVPHDVFILDAAHPPAPGWAKLLG